VAVTAAAAGHVAVAVAPRGGEEEGSRGEHVWFGDGGVAVVMKLFVWLVVDVVDGMDGWVSLGKREGVTSGSFLIWSARVGEVGTVRKRGE